MAEIDESNSRSTTLVGLWQKLVVSKAFFLLKVATMVKVQIILLLALLQHFQTVKAGGGPPKFVGNFDMRSNIMDYGDMFVYWRAMEYPEESEKRYTENINIEDMGAGKGYKMVCTYRYYVSWEEHKSEHVLNFKLDKASSQVHPNGQTGTLLVTTNPEKNKLVEEWKFNKGLNATSVYTFDQKDDMILTLMVKDLSVPLYLDRLPTKS